MKQPLILALFIGLILVFGCKDEEGEVTISNDSGDTTKIYLFRSTASLQGTLGGTSGADNICRSSTEKPVGIENTNVHALLSTASQEVKNFPTLFSLPDAPIVGPTGIVIFDNWADLSNPSKGPKLSLTDAGVFTSAPISYWTGTTADGSASNTDCSSWTSTSGSGSRGVSGSVDPTSWINSGNLNCTLYPYLICLGYK